MSIINVQARATTSDQDFEALRFADNSILRIDSGDCIEPFSVEFTVGLNWSRKYGPGSNQMETIPETGISLRPGESVVIEVKEAIRVPYNMYGLVIPTGSLFLDNGIILAAAKIEPSFHDRLKLRLVNISGERRVLKPEQKVASAIFFSTDRTIFLPDKRKGIVSVTRLPGRARRVLAWISTNRLHVIGWIIALVGSAVANGLWMRYYPVQ